jgi:hypothetical protein
MNLNLLFIFHLESKERWDFVTVGRFCYLSETERNKPTTQNDDIKRGERLPSDIETEINVSRETGECVEWCGDEVCGWL